MKCEKKISCQADIQNGMNVLQRSSKKCATWTAHVLWELSIRNVKQCQQEFTLQQQGCDFEIAFCVKVPLIYFYR